MNNFKSQKSKCLFINKKNATFLKIKNMFFYIIKFFSILLSFIIIKYSFFYNISLFNNKFINYVKPNKFNLIEYFDNDDYIKFNLSSIEFSINSGHDLIKVEYLIDFYDKANNIIIPSDLTLYYNYSIFCFFNETKNNNIIISIAYVFENLRYRCFEFFTKEEILLGIMIKNNKNKEFKIINFFSLNELSFIKYNIKIDNEFDCFLINKEYIDLLNQINDVNISLNNNLKFKRSYILKPYCKTKTNINLTMNEWHYINFYNNYSCFCNGLKCLYKNISQYCKFFFYLNIIDNSRHLFNKTDYLLADFIYNQYSSDDTYPVFQEMIKQKLPAHYLTQNRDIYNKYCYLKKSCLSIIPVISNATIDGDFLEKYLNLFLKLKAAITGASFMFINNLFYNIDYIQYISVGHGVSFFKHFLYKSYSYYGNKIFNKILIPPSQKLINIAKKYNWTDDNIIKINLPRWNIYDNYESSLKTYNKDIVKNSSIFIMFTWRFIRSNKNISSDYIYNILELINNKLLNKILISNNITLYFTLHHQFLKYKEKFKIDNNVKYINENQISIILKTTNLIVTDFSSIIFDIIYREKPFIIYIPDANDSEIINNYSEEYFKLIQDIKNGSIEFENKFFNVNETVNKIIFYINNNFQLEQKLKNFYDSFGFKHDESINKFINYLKK